MSKVHKALQRIREGRSEAVSEREKARMRRAFQVDADPETENGSANGARQERTGITPDKRAEILSDTASLPSIVVPTESVEWSHELLNEYGLLLPEQDVHDIESAYRRIKRPLIANAFRSGGIREDNANVVMIASALPGAGKSLSSYTLALSIAQERDITAVLVDADVLKPTVSRAFGLEDRIGLIDYLEDDSLTIDDILVKVGEEGILTIPAGSQKPNATELLASRRMKKFVRALSHNFSDSVVIVDTPPMLITTEAQVLAEHVGQLCLVVEAGETSHEQMLQVLESLDRSKPINAILNKSRIRSNADGYGYGYGYGYGK